MLEQSLRDLSIILTRDDLRAVNETARLTKNRHLGERCRESGAHATLVLNETLPCACRPTVAGERIVRSNTNSAGYNCVELGFDKKLGVEFRWCAVERRTLNRTRDSIRCSD